MATRTPMRSKPSTLSPARILAIAAAVLVVVIIALLTSVQVGYAGRIYPGVEAMGVDIGGKSPDEAKGLLERRWTEYSQTPLSLRWETRAWQVTPAALGLSASVDETVAKAYQVGRSGSVFARIGQQFTALGAGGHVDAATTLDQAKARAEIERIDAEVRRSPQNAGLDIGAGGSVSIRPSKAGVAVDVAKAIGATQSSLLAFGAGEITLPSVEVPVRLDDAALAQARDRAVKLVGQPITLTAGDKSWTLTSKDIAALLSVAEDNGKPVVKLDEAALTRRLDSIAAEIKHPAADAKLKLNGTKVEIVPGSDGEELDVPSSQTMILARLGESTTMPLVLKKIEALPSDKLVETRTRLNGALSGPVSFKFEDKTFTLAADELATMIVLVDGAAGKPQSVKVDDAAFAAFAKTIAKQVDRNPQDARFKFEGGQAKVVAEGIDGAKLDVAKSQAALEAYLASPSSSVALSVALSAPEVTSAAAGQIVVRDLIMESTTPTAGSISAKMFNMQLATSRLNGTVVPPGGTFSFNRALGPATLASGFKLGYGIAVDAKGQMQTVPSEAGGICQVASTLFHSVFWSGYPIVERNWHMYWIPKYGGPPRGLKGLDATVDDAYGVDFQFKNPTDNWLVIESSATGGYVHFALRGIKPDWKVAVGDPKVTNVVPAKREMVYEPDPSMADGQSLMVEGAEDGFDVSIERTVTQGDTVVDHWFAKAHYRPSRNVTLVSPNWKAPPTGSATPKASGTPAPAGTGTPAPAAGTPAPKTTPQPTKATTPAPAATPTPKKAP